MIGTIAIILSSSVTLPQLIRVIKTKDVSGLSWMMYAQLGIACTLFIIKAFMMGTPFFAISYSFNLLASIVMLLLIRRHGDSRRNTRKRTNTSKVSKK